MFQPLNLKSIKILNIFLLSVSTVYAVETDQYMTWGKSLPDSAEAINVYLNQKILKVVNSINQKKRHQNVSCQKAADEVFQELKGKVTFSAFSMWTARAEHIAKYPDPKKMSLRQFALSSVHRGMKFRNFFVKPARTINVNGVYFGVDKLGHFSFVGHKYYELYLEALQAQKTKEEAILDAVKYGAWNERYLLGFYISGVYSLADLEANYQGLMMGIDFCEGDNRIFVKSPEGFAIRRPIDIRDYINPDFDESYNYSVFNPHKFKQMKEDLKKYCSVKNADYVRERFQDYQNRFKPSFNTQFLRNFLQPEEFFQRRETQSLNTICE